MSALIDSVHNQEMILLRARMIRKKPAMRMNGATFLSNQPRTQRPGNRLDTHIIRCASGINIGIMLAIKKNTIPIMTIRYSGDSANRPFSGLAFRVGGGY